MTPEAVVGKVFGVDPRQVTDTTSGQTLEPWDSLGHVTLVLELEATYGLSFSAEETLQMTDVGAIKRVLRDRGAAW
jgi:acyl carrier protein